MPLPTQGRGRLVNVAIELFYRYGINPVGLDRILTEAGVSKTTFYKHFDSKDSLVVAALQTRDQWETDAWARAVEKRAGRDPHKALLVLWDVLDEWFNAPDYGGCQFINAAAEFPNPHDPIHKVAAEHKRRTRDWFADLARQAGADDPDRFADTYTMLFEGSLILRQVHGRDDAARLARPVIEKLIADHIPEP